MARERKQLNECHSAEGEKERQIEKVTFCNFCLIQFNEPFQERANLQKSAKSCKSLLKLLHSLSHSLSHSLLHAKPTFSLTLSLAHTHTQIFSRSLTHAHTVSLSFLLVHSHGECSERVSLATF